MVVQSADRAARTLPLWVGSLVPVLSESRLHINASEENTARQDRAGKKEVRPISWSKTV